MTKTLVALLSSGLFYFGVYKLIQMFRKNRTEAISLDIFLARENKVRKIWLVSFWIFSTLSFANLTAMLLEKNGSFIEVFGFWQALVINLFFAAIPLSISCWITYNCAYFKKGTTWLKWLLITIPGKEFIGVVRELSSSSDSLPITIAILSIGLGIALFYWICSLRLHNINSARKTLITPDLVGV